MQLMRRRWHRAPLSAVIGFVVVPLAAAPATAQVPCTIPASQRPSEIGCYFSAAESLVVAPQQPIYWHLYTYPSRNAAAATGRGVIVKAFDKTWLYVIAEAGWRPIGGKQVARIGPLPVTPGERYTARYMEAVFGPGMRTRAHTHSGPEAWYVLTGAQCLETPDQTIIARAGESALVQQGPPMVLSSVGKETRRAVLLVLHEASAPWSTRENEWTPKGSCPP
jgi:quercetin dioxygenase-like cupin family protein